MQVLIDANVFISYLLHPGRTTAVVNVVEAGILGDYTVLLPAKLRDDIAVVIRNKDYLARRISPQQLDRLWEGLELRAKDIPEITEEIPPVTRDPKDDYLIAYALVGEADYLVSGDPDLQALEQVESVRIMSPVEFWEILEGLVIG